MDVPSTSGYVKPIKLPKDMAVPSTSGYVKPTKLPKSMAVPSTSGYVKPTKLPKSMAVPSTSGYVKPTKLPKSMAVPSTSGYVKPTKLPKSMAVPSTSGYVKPTKLPKSMAVPSTSGYVKPATLPENMAVPSTSGYVKPATLPENMDVPSTSGYVNPFKLPANVAVPSTLGYAMPMSMSGNMYVPSTSTYMPENIYLQNTFGHVTPTNMLMNMDISSGYMNPISMTENMDVSSTMGYMNPINKPQNKNVPSEDEDYPDFPEGWEIPSSPEATDLPNKTEATDPEPEPIIIEYCFDSQPFIADLKVVDLLSLKKVWRRVEVIKSDKFPKLKRRYFEELNNFINKWRHWDRRLALNPTRKESSLFYFISDIMQYISTELGKADKKSLLLLKAFHYFLSNVESMIEEKSALKNKCHVSLRKFVTNSSECKTLKYLLKDIAADILPQLSSVSLTSPAAKLFTRSFRYLLDSHDDMYGSTLAWLSNVTPETAGKLVHFEAKYSDALATRSLNCPRILRRLLSICESCVCCERSQSETVPLTETTGLPSQSENVSQMEIDGQIQDVSQMEIDGQIESVSLTETKLLYDPDLVKDFILLIRNENIYTPVFHLKYEHSLSKPFQFSELIFEDLKRRVMSHAVRECPNMFDERETQDLFFKPKDLQKDTDLLQSSFVTEHKKSYIEEGSFWGYWDIFSNVKPHVDAQLLYFGHLSFLENLHYDIYSKETTNRHLISVSPSDMDPQNIKRPLNIFDVFVMPENCNKKPPRKRKKKEVPVETIP